MPYWRAFAVGVTLTPKGRDALTKAAPQHSEHVRRLFIDCLTPEQLDQLADISATVLANLQRPENGQESCAD